jgi:hypothetical protein
MAMRPKFLVACVLASMALGLSTANAQAVSINFDDGVANTIVGNSYGGVTFSGASFTESLGFFGTSGALGIANTNTLYNWTASDAITVTFNNAAASFSIGVVDLGENGFTLQAYNSSGTLVATNTIFGADDGDNNYQVISVAGTDITEVRMFQALDITAEGVFLDNMNYTLAPVPEPKTYALMMLGLVGMGTLSRRRRSR